MTYNPRDAVEQFGEGVARQIARRQFLRRSAATIFGVVAAWAVEGIRPRSTLAAECYRTTSSYVCSPPPYWNPTYCNNVNPSWCVGADCVAPDCRPNFDAGWPTACWCTLESCDGSYLGYFVCCDCYCASDTVICGCAQFVRTAPC
jgi:hypothetical protein